LIRDSGEICYPFSYAKIEGAYRRLKPVRLEGEFPKSKPVKGNDLEK
jgi:hypothetical protein